MKPFWILEQLEGDETYEKLKTTLEAHNVKYRISSLGDLVANRSMVSRSNSIAPDRGAFIAQGEIDFIQEVQRQRYFPGTYASFENYRWSNWAPYYDGLLFNNEYIILPAVVFRKYGEWLRDIFQSDMLFVKSDSGTKHYSGSVHNFSDEVKYDGLIVISNSAAGLYDCDYDKIVESVNITIMNDYNNRFLKKDDND